MIATTHKPRVATRRPTILPAPEPRFDKELATIPPLPFRRGEGRGEGKHSYRPAAVIAITILLVLPHAIPALALDELPYAVAKTPWDESLGNHRAIVHVAQAADAVLVNIPWRRRDCDPERKQIIIVDAFAADLAAAG